MVKSNINAKMNHANSNYLQINYVSMANARVYAYIVVAQRYASINGFDIIVLSVKGLEYVNIANFLGFAKYAKLSQGMRELHLQPIWRGCLQPVLKPAQAFRRSRPSQPSAPGLSTAVAHEKAHEKAHQNASMAKSRDCAKFVVDHTYASMK